MTRLPWPVLDGEKMKFSHIGFGVNDIRTTMAAYADLAGFEWDTVQEHDVPLRGPSGEAEPSRALIAHGTTSDGLVIELSQQIGGETPDQFLLRGREGVSHVAFTVDDLAAERARLVGSGYRIIKEGSAERAKWLFVQDDRLGGTLVQLVEYLNGP